MSGTTSTASASRTCSTSASARRSSTPRWSIASTSIPAGTRRGTGASRGASSTARPCRRPTRFTASITFASSTRARSSSRRSTAGRGTLLLGGRYSYTGLLLSMFSPYTVLSYWDYQARATYALTPSDRVGVFVFGADDFLGQKASGTTQTLFGTQFHRVDVRYDHRLSEDGTIRTAITFGEDLTDIGDGQSVRDRLTGARTEIAYRAVARRAPAHRGRRRGRQVRRRGSAGYARAQRDRARGELLSFEDRHRRRRARRRRAHDPARSRGDARRAARFLRLAGHDRRGRRPAPRGSRGDDPPLASPVGNGDRAPAAGFRRSRCPAFSRAG